MDRITISSLVICVSYFLVLSLPSLVVYGVVQAPGFLEALATTAAYSTIATLIVLPLSTLLGYALSFKDKAKYMEPLILFSTAIPHTAIGILLSPLIYGLRIADTGVAIIVGMVIVSTPIAMGVLRTSFSSQGTELQEYLRAMGVNGRTILWIYFRSSPVGILVASLLGWFRSFSELGAFLIIAQRPKTVGIYLYEEFLRMGPQVVASASLLLLGIALTVAFIVVVMESGPRDT